MTPLPWWVLLLAALLARTTAVPAQKRPTVDACVALCRADSSSGFCDYRDLVRQFDERLGGARGLLRLCLTPCAIPSTNSLTDLAFEPSELCRKLRISILEQRACVCDHPEDQNFYHPPQRSRNVFEEDLEWVEELVEEYSTALSSKNQPIDLVTMKILASHGVKLGNLRAENRHDKDQVISDVQLTFPGKYYNSAMKEDEVIDHSVGGDSVHAAGSIMNPLDVNQSGSTPVPEVLDTTLAEVDWEKWCMTQCSTGHGGSACCCDIIP